MLGEGDRRSTKPKFPFFMKEGVDCRSETTTRRGSCEIIIFQFFMVTSFHFVTLHNYLPRFAGTPCFARYRYAALVSTQTSLCSFSLTPSHKEGDTTSPSLRGADPPPHHTARCLRSATPPQGRGLLHFACPTNF